MTFQWTPFIQFHDNLFETTNKSQRNGIVRSVIVNENNFSSFKKYIILFLLTEIVRIEVHRKKKIQTNTGIESSEYESIVVHTTQHVKILTKSLHNSCFHTVLLLPLAFKSSEIDVYALDNELTRDRNNCKCRSTSFNCNWTPPIFLRSRMRTLGTIAHLLTGVRSQLTHMSDHTQPRLNQYFFVPQATNLPCSPQTHC